MSLQPSQAANNRADGGAVDVGDIGEIEDHADVIVADQRLRFLFDLSAVGSGMNAAFHIENGDAVQLRFFHVHDHESCSVLWK